MRPLIVAHRGDSKYYPENTRSAFISAMKKEADLLETDVRKTKDGKLICIHDAYVDRVTNWKHSGYVRNLESELLERMRVFNPMTGREDRILFFDDFLELTRGERIIVEIKESGIEEEVVEKILEYGREKESIISSFVYESLEKVKKLKHDIKRIIIYTYPPLDFYEQVLSHEVDGLAISYASLDLISKEIDEKLKKLRRKGKLLGVYTIDDQKIIKEVSDYVDVVVTNDPGLAKTCLE